MDPLIVVAVVTQAGTLAGLALTHRKAKNTDRIVQGNGKGDVSVMLDHLIRSSDRIEEKIDRHVENHG